MGEGAGGGATPTAPPECQSRTRANQKDRMEILGIGPGEFILIMIVLLVVVGPERLPGLARQAGAILVRARTWLQTSPDAAMVLRARAEIEAELASIKNSLLEVQVVRDEVMGAAKQLGDSVG